MRMKDWVLLIVPIICNGFFIFLFQTSIQSRIAEKNRKRDQKRKIIDEFITLLNSAKNHLALVESVIDASEKTINDFQEYWAIAFQYRLVHEYVLDIFSDDVIKINRLNSELIEILGEFWEEARKVARDKYEEIEGYIKYGEYYAERRTQLLDELNKLCKKCLEFKIK